MVNSETFAIHIPEARSARHGAFGQFVAQILAAKAR